ncbi:hypothetical protein DFJ73DRAFT_819224 [Zopfochytrium polystomum]|nr:hypothetical protein DFJ73DRAFT_819224 [Zopfochytrium polystomum]
MPDSARARIESSAWMCPALTGCVRRLDGSAVAARMLYRCVWQNDVAAASSSASGSCDAAGSRARFSRRRNGGPEKEGSLSPPSPPSVASGQRGSRNRTSCAIFPAVRCSACIPSYSAVRMDDGTRSWNARRDMIVRMLSFINAVTSSITPSSRHCSASLTARNAAPFSKHAWQPHVNPWQRTYTCRTHSTVRSSNCRKSAADSSCEIRFTNVGTASRLSEAAPWPVN